MINKMSEIKNSTECSLTTPEDRDQVNKWKPDQSSSDLSENEVTEAMKDINNIDFTSKFRKIERTYADPPPPMQKIGLISFIPAKGATPNKDGIYGFAKLRGNYDNSIEANQRAEFIIRKVDSYHQIFHTYVGRPFPLTVSSKYSAETSEIDIKKATSESISNSVKEKRDEDQQVIQEINNKEKQLLSEHKKAVADEPIDTYENYITLRVKKAQLIWTYLEHQKKIVEIKDILIKTRSEITDLDNKFPDYQNTYYDKYKQARIDAGLKNETEEDLKSNFLQFLVEDAEASAKLGF